MSTATPTRKDFVIHRNALSHLFRHQAGTLDKAIMELVMNSIDAKATQCFVTLTGDTVIVQDNGKGFTSSKEIERCFATVGSPYSEEESGSKTYGAFRMGRGQAFAFGKNTWRSNRYQMYVDIDEDLDGFLLTELDEPVDGCEITIELSTPMCSSAIRYMQGDLENNLQYVPIDLYIRRVADGEMGDFKQVVPQALPPTTTRYKTKAYTTYLHDETSHGIAVYNQGVYVMTIPPSNYGLSGVINTHQRLGVNYARNDVLASCPLWQRIVKRLNKVSLRTIAEKRTLTADQRTRLIDSIVRGAVPYSVVQDAKLVCSVTGRYYTLEEVAGWQTIASALLGDPLGDMVHQTRQAFVIAEQTLSAFRVSSCNEWKLLLQRIGGLHASTERRFKAMEPRDLLDIVQGEEARYQFRTIPETDYTATERLWLSLLAAAWTNTAIVSWQHPRPETRTLYIGLASNDTAAWTDGNFGIWFNRNWLRKQRFSRRGVSAVAHTLVHEYCHDSSNRETHVHGYEFYEKFHDYAVTIGEITVHVLGNLSWQKYSRELKVTKAESSLAAKIRLGEHVGADMVELLRAAGVDFAKL